MLIPENISPFLIPSGPLVTVRLRCTAPNIILKPPTYTQAWIFVEDTIPTYSLTFVECAFAAATSSPVIQSRLADVGQQPPK
jgi:hypothetical protein